MRTLPVASVDQIAKTCDFWLAKSSGDYGHPSTRHLFELAHELKALIEPLRAEELRKDTRLHHLEEMLAQWNECAPRASFLAPVRGCASPSRQASEDVFKL